MDCALIGIDLGTTGCKSAVLDERLNILGEEYLEYSLINISDIEIEQDADEWWDIVRRVVKASVRKSGISPGAVKGISVSSQGIAFVPVDNDCRPLDNAISWLDTRADGETQRIIERFNEHDVYSITGKRISRAYTLPKLIWLKDNRPGVYESAHKFLMPHDFITAKLCGSFVTDHTMASGTLAYDINNQMWWTKILDEFDIDAGRLPDIACSGTAAGRLRPDVASDLGLSQDVTVAVGGQDQKCAALGAGIHSGIFTVSLGTATAIEGLSNRAATDHQMRIPVFSYLFKNKWAMEGVVSTSGVSLKWLKNTFFRNTSYGELDKMAGEHTDSPGSVFFYPFLGGAGSPYWYDNARGCFYGINLSTDTAEMIKSVLEGIAYQIRSNMDTMEQTIGRMDGAIVFGGGSASSLWCQMIADITGRGVSTMHTPQTACVGAAILAGMGCGIFKSAEEARFHISVKDVYRPREHMIKPYEERYQEYINTQHRVFNR